MENFDSIYYGLVISGNSSLTNISALERLSYVKMYIDIIDNQKLTSLAGLDNIDTVGSISLLNNESLQHLQNLNNLSRVTELHIENNPSLVSLSGLENLTYVGEDLKIFDNDLLADLQGLNGLKHIVSTLKIRYNDQLASLNGMENVDTIRGGISICDNSTLSSLESIANAYLDFILSIYNNPMLEVCHIHSICELLSGDPYSVNIYNNAPGCNSEEEVEELCLVQISDKNQLAGFTVYPIPTKNTLLISKSENIKIDHCLIRNQLGQIVATENPIDNKINVSQLRTGVYFIEIARNGKAHRIKFVKE